MRATWCSAAELEHAHNPSERDRASYFPENFVPMEESGQWWLLDGDHEIVPGVELIRVPGHNARHDVREAFRRRQDGHASWRIWCRRPRICRSPWIMGFDLYPLQTLENKKKWIPQVGAGRLAGNFWPRSEVRAGYLREKDGKVVAEPVAVD